MRLPILPTLPTEKLGPIPPVVHQIWVGKPPPAWVENMWAQWDSFAAETGLTVRRWTNDDLAGTLTHRLISRYPFLTPVKIADFLRIEVVSLYGGMYMDSDTVPLRPLDEYVGDRPAWIGQGPTNPRLRGKEYEQAARLINNAAFGFPAHHPFLTDLWDSSTAALGRGIKGTFNLAGPRAYRREVDRGVHTDVQVPRGPFISKNRFDKTEERKLGRPFTTAEMRDRHPEAVVAHLSMESWVEDSAWNRSYNSEIWGAEK